MYSNVLIVCIILSVSFQKVIDAVGTTPNIQEIFIGKCWEYQRSVNSDAFVNGIKNCTDLWLKFRDAFAYKEPCNTTAEDYRPFFEAAVHYMEPDRHLFWESIYPFVNDYSDNGKRYVTVTDTLLGFMANILTWCGQRADPGINYDECPQRVDCTGFITDYNYWIMASQYYAEGSSGIAYVMLNGSRSVPFDPNRIFAMYELVKLTPEKNVTKLNILVVHNLGGPVTESCGEGSILNLENTARDQGLEVTCVNNLPSIRHFQCVDNPTANECTISVPDGTSFGISSHKHVNVLLVICVALLIPLLMLIHFI